MNSLAALTPERCHSGRVISRNSPAAAKAAAEGEPSIAALKHCATRPGKKRPRYSHRVEQDNRLHSLRVGLCVSCKFMRRIESDRESTFYLCQRSLTDASFAKYPRLPVLQCAGYDPIDETPRGTIDSKQ